MKRILGAGLTVAFVVGAFAAPVTAEPPDCNWGRLTHFAIAELDFDQGAHSSDPAGDGHGRPSDDQPRAGLGNVVERGNLEATCELIESTLED